MLKLLDGQTCGHDISDFLESDVAGLVNQELLAFLLARRHEFKHIDTHDVAWCESVLQLAGHKILGRRRDYRRARSTLTLNHIEARENRHRCGRGFEVAGATWIHP